MPIPSLSLRLISMDDVNKNGDTLFLAKRRKMAFLEFHKWQY